MQGLLVVATNQEIADSFRSRIENFNHSVPWDYFDRSVDLAIYYNDTIPEDDEQKTNIIQMIQDAMVLAYVARDNVFEVKEEVDDPNPGSEEVPRN